jgi:tRNA G18 (ribose-2'-O)-methylase SpoU
LATIQSPKPDPVDGPDDTRMEPFRAMRERDLVGRSGRFIAEGEVVLRVLLEADRFVIDTILVSERVARIGRSWFAAIPTGTTFISAPDAVIEAVSGFHVHRGVLATARRKSEPDASALLADLGPDALAVACIGIANHDNMGGIFRNAAAFGAVVAFLDETSCDPLYRKAIRVSVGGVFKVPFVRGGSAETIVDTLDRAGFTVLALSPGGREALHELRVEGRIALLLGAEGEGLPRELLDRLRTLRIRMAPGFDSLNVAVSAGIAMHHLSNR